MAFERPTYDDSWHRIAETKPRLRSTVQCGRQQYRGRQWYVVMDPSNNQHFRLSAAGYRFVGLLDGRRSIQDAWEAVQEQLEDEAPTQGEALRLIGQLHTSNLLDHELSPDAGRMFERRQKRIRKEVGGYLKNLLFARVPIWDPDRFLNRWLPAVAWLFGPVGWVLWAGLLVLGGWSLLGRFDELWAQTGNVLAPQNLIWLYVCLVGIKLLHELGHAFACKRFGRRRHGQGEVHTVGIMLMVLTPVPYVDATSAWTLPSKWQRAFVGAAGMYAELAVAAVAAVVWSQTADGTLAHALAYNLIFIAGVSTILFNANPLIKFDGYYILSDVIETPNLYQRAQQYMTYLIRRYVYGVRQLINPAAGGNLKERFWFVVFGLASLAYRLFLGVVIIMFVADKLFFIGAIFVILALVGYLVIPSIKLVHYLSASPEPARVRGRAVLATVLMIGGPLLVLGWVPVPDRPRALGVLEPARLVTVHAEAEGFVESIAGSDAEVSAGGVLVSAANPRLDAEVLELEARQALLEARYRRAVVEEPIQRQVIAEQLAATRDLLAKARERRASLVMTAGFAGTWTPALDDDVQGHYVRRGEPVGVLAETGRLTVRVAADQFEGPRLLQADHRVEVRPTDQPDRGFSGRVVQAMPAGQRRLPSAALSEAAGGQIATDPTDPQGTTAAEPYFEIVIEPELGEAADAEQVAWAMQHGQTVVVRFSLPDKPLLQQWYRSARQVLQRRFQVPGDPNASPLGLSL
ncbi:MAG: PqqD family peptide modification chaperone [Planctomycetota bacterium]